MSDGFGVLVKGRQISKEMERTLNSLVVDEFNAIHNYLMHSAVCGGWGLKALEAKFLEESHEEMGHAKLLMDRITVFDKIPTLQQFAEVERILDVKAIINKQLDLEMTALRDYNKAVKLARKEGDNGTKGLLQKILMDEEKHYDWLKAQLDMIDRMGVENYLTEQMEDETEKAMGASAAMGVESLDENLKPNLNPEANKGIGGRPMRAPAAPKIVKPPSASSQPHMAKLFGKKPSSTATTIKIPTGMRSALRPRR